MYPRLKVPQVITSQPIALREMSKSAVAINKKLRNGGLVFCCCLQNTDSRDGVHLSVRLIDSFVLLALAHNLSISYKRYKQREFAMNISSQKISVVVIAKMCGINFLFLTETASDAA